MRVLVTGGAGFIGRWVVKKLLEEEHAVLVLDDLSNGDLNNISDFQGKKPFRFIKGSVLDCDLLDSAFKGIDTCIHLAAQINVQESLECPEKSFRNNVVGTYNVLEKCRGNNVKLLLAGTCMVYDVALSRAINEEHPVKPASPYSGSKIAIENLALSYYHGYGLPVVILRPFNTYGPYQKSNMEGGVISIFAKRHLEGKELLIYGDGEQTRDFLYVEDCADFIVKAAFNDKAVGEVINAGTGRDISISKLALLICKDEARIRYVPHIHPLSEIRKLVCDYSKAARLLGWEPITSMEEGLRKTIQWVKSTIKPSNQDYSLIK